MLRLLLLVASIVIVLVLIKRRLSQALQKPPQQPPSVPTEAKTEKVVRCDHCGTHIPDSEAITHQGQHFCCPAHQHDYQQR